MPHDAQARDRGIPWPQGHEPASAVVFAHHEVQVEASPQEVWSLLVNCMAWPQWYKHCSDVSVLRGGPSLQAHSKFRFKTLGRYFEPTVVTFEPPRMLIWSAAGPVGTSGSHAWRIEPTASGCKVVTEEAQKGLLLRLLGSFVRTRLLAAHEDWLRSLKALAEGEL